MEQINGLDDYLEITDKLSNLKLTQNNFISVQELGMQNKLEQFRDIRRNYIVYDLNELCAVSASYNIYKIVLAADSHNNVYHLKSFPRYTIGVGINKNNTEDKKLYAKTVDGRTFSLNY